MILAPLRGVTIRCFRETFAKEIGEAGFTEAITPFIPAISGFDPLKDRELGPSNFAASSLALTPQFIGKDPRALKMALGRVKSAGFSTADLNCGCPFPMVRNKGRGAGILRTPEILRAMLEVGCEVMGPGKFSIKTRLGVDRKDELLALMPMINEFPLRYLTIHARTARQMYEGECDWVAAALVIQSSRIPIVRNGDLDCSLSDPTDTAKLMVGRSFIRALGERSESGELLRRYCRASQEELFGDAPVLGRIKELVSYWKECPAWKSKWNILKFCRSVAELCDII